MQTITRIDVDRAARDLRERTLAFLEGPFSRLVYLASTRDYNTGQYYHDGLASRFSSDAAGLALASQHGEAFEALLFAPLDRVVQALDAFVSSTPATRAEILEMWSTLEPYRMIIPQKCDPVARDLFFSNVRIALAILQARQPENPASPQFASPPQ